jgi:predicted aldo/keto reductase-like oxidoreductase
MFTRRLGRSDLQVSILGMGSSPFRYGTAADCGALLTQALDAGVTYYDTARSYVNGEEAVAQLSPGDRNRLIVATKTGARVGQPCLHDLQKSLATMRRSYIDVWMAHMVRDDEEYDACTALGGFCDVAMAAKQAGIVRAIGASFHASTDLILRAIQDDVFDVVMFQFNVIGRETLFGSSIESYRTRLIPAARTRGAGVVVMKVLAGGELQHGAPNLDFVADRSRGRDTVGGAVRYAALNPDIGVAVVGMSTSEELWQNVAAVEDVDDADVDTFNDWTARVRALDAGPCTRCGACLGACPEQIEIPKVFRQYDQYRYFGMTGVAQYRYSELAVTAAACNQCRKCQEVCPEPFDIADGLKAAHVALDRRRQDDVTDRARQEPRAYG